MLPDYFNPRSPYGERLSALRAQVAARNFNPRSPYGERPGAAEARFACPPISIHAPLTGSDDAVPPEPTAEEISIHAPLTGSDLGEGAISFEDIDFNPRSPYGERPAPSATLSSNSSFQSTLPLRGATQAVCLACGRAQFQSTLPLRGATAYSPTLSATPEISIHAPLTGSDVGPIL